MAQFFSLDVQCSSTSGPDSTWSTCVLACDFGGWGGGAGLGLQFTDQNLNTTVKKPEHKGFKGCNIQSSPVQLCNTFSQRNSPPKHVSLSAPDTLQGKIYTVI